MHKADQLYFENITKILEHGYDDFGQDVRPKWADGSPAHTKFILNVQETYNLAAGEFPFTVLRPTAFKSAIGEILWIYRDASNDLNRLRDQYGVTWWDEWADHDYTIGECYGKTVHNWNLFNNLIHGLKTNPFGRRHIMSLWQNADLTNPHGLDPCCYLTHWQVTKKPGEDRLTLHLKLEQRSNDYIVAGYINKIQYVALQIIVAREVGMDLGTFTHSVANLHIYDRHFSAARELLSRYQHLPLCVHSPKPQLILDKDATLETVMPSDFSTKNYYPLEALPKLPVAI